VAGEVGRCGDVVAFRGALEARGADDVVGGLRGCDQAEDVLGAIFVEGELVSASTGCLGF
jgi:hypothetical protein